MGVSNGTLIEASALSVGYGRRTVLEAVDLRVGTGELWFVLGANGTGKTSFVRTVLGLLSPLAGALYVDPELGARRRIGFVPQACELNPTLRTTVREFVSLGLVGTGVRARDAEERLEGALATVGLAGRRSTEYAALSGGMRQRALLARALVRQPTLLILDEPTAGLDPAAEDALVRLLVALNAERGVTGLVVTHNVEIASRYASHVALFHAGRVAAGRREDVLKVESLAAIYNVAPDRAGLFARGTFGGHP